MNISLSDLDENARDLATRSLEWSEARWDEAGALLAGESRRNSAPVLQVRNSVWTAAGFLLRNDPGDLGKASRTIAAILDTQFDEPGMPYHGTFPRYIGEPHPPGKEAVMWKDYDPNWRQFIGTGLAVILEEYEGRLEKALVDRMDRALELAIVGEPPDRCPPSYSNIALMKTALGVWVGTRLGRPEMVAYHEEFGAEVHRLFAENDAFDEYNSPTYYGVNLYALAFWRRYMPSEKLKPLGAYLEEGLWRDIARYYHPGLQNLCGPYTRSYGMDMTWYTALVSLPMWLALGRDLTPFPPERKINMEFAYGPCMAILGANMPADLRDSFTSFGGPHQLERRITTDPERIATAWFDEEFMCGAESTGGWYKTSSQFHPVTAHWRAPSGEVATFRLDHTGPIDARADKGRITISAPVRAEFTGASWRSNDFVFEIYAPGASESDFASDEWTLPGLTVAFDTNLPDVAIESEGHLFRITFSTEQAPFDASFALNLKRT